MQSIIACEHLFIMIQFLYKKESRNNMTNLIIIKSLKKAYRKNNNETIILNDLNVSFESNKFYAIMGHSGSGKSTLINIIGLIETATSGEYYLNGKNISDLNENEKANIRAKYFGFIFQDYNLDPNLKAYENVMLPMLIDKKVKNIDAKEKAIKLLESLDLAHRINHYPKELSGGEQQRVAIARALANNPEIILADEPTGNLDKKNEQKIFSDLKKLSESGKCVIVVSHSLEIKEYADVIFTLEDGTIRW